MIRPIFALFTRAVREDSRAKAPYIARGVLAAVILMFLFFTEQTSKFMGAPGMMFFMSVVHINFFFVTLAGIGYFSSAITEEKEETTLGLLRMTSLNPLSILLGKSTSRLFGAVLLLLAQFPFTLLAVTLGGVSIGQVVAVYCTLAAYVFFLCNLALFGSVVCKRTGAAASLTGLLLFAFYVVPSWVEALLQLAIRLKYVSAKSGIARVLEPVFGWMRAASPYTRLEQILRTGFSDTPVGFQVLADVAMGAGFFLLAWVCFDRFTRNETESAPRRGFLFRKTSPLRLFGPGRAWTRALFWKEFHFSTGGKTGMLVRFVGFGLLAVYWAWMLGIPRRGNSRHWDAIGYSMMAWMYFFFALELSLAASRLFRQEIKWKTLSSLGMLPVTVGHIAWQKVAASLVACLPAAFYFLIGFALTAKDIAHSFAHDHDSGYVLGVLILVVLETVFFLFLVLFLSLIIKRGALPLAVAIAYLGNMFAGLSSVMTIGGNGGPAGIMIVMGIGLICCTGVLLRLIGPGLTRAIAAD